MVEGAVSKAEIEVKIEFNCTKILNTNRFSVEQELAEPENVCSVKQETANHLVDYCKISTIVKADDNSSELHENSMQKCLIKEEMESDCDDNFELLQSDIKKEFEAFDRQDKNIKRSRHTILENNPTAHNYDKAYTKQGALDKCRKHMESHGRKSRIRCGFCNETFKNDEDLDVHHRNIHKKLKFSCDYCGKVYLSMYSIEKHVKKVHCQIQCVKCKEIFSDRALFTKHRRQHEQGSELECQYCHKKFDTSKNLYLHINRQHERYGAVKKCDICNKEFINIQLLKRHYGRTHDKCFKCPHCDKAFALRCSFERHFLTHTGARDYKCNVCGKRFSRQRSFKNHVALHSDERSFQCAQCPKAYKTQPSLYIHKQRIHNFSCASGKIFQCYICSQEFTSKLSLINHIRKHSTSKPFDCQICSKQFKCKLGYTEHMNLHEHKKTKQEQVPDFCNGNFSTQDLLIDHLAHMNPKEENI